MGKSSINGQFPMAMLNNQRVGDFEHHLKKVSVGDYTLSWVMSNKEIYQPLFYHQKKIVFPDKFMGNPPSSGLS